MRAIIEGVLLMMLMLPSMVYAQTKTPTGTESFYDHNGSFAGSASTRGNATTFTDRNGRFDGTSIRNSDGTTSFYDRNGHFTGSRSNTTQPR